MSSTKEDVNIKQKNQGDSEREQGRRNTDQEACMNFVVRVLTNDDAVRRFRATRSEKPATAHLRPRYPLESCDSLMLFSERKVKI